MDILMNLAGTVFLFVFALLAMQFGIIVVSVFKKEQNYKAIEPHVSVIIPAYNEEASIGETVQHVLNSDYPLSKREVIVIDDGSDDKTVEIVKKFDGVKLLTQNHKGKVAALNYGMKAAKSDILVTIDADTKIERNFIREIIQPFSDAKVGGVAAPPRVANPKGIFGIFQRIEYIYNALIRDSFSAVAKSVIIGFGGALAAYRKSVIKEIGGFNSDTVTEDFDTAVQIERAGYKTVCAKNAVGYTVVPKNFKGLFKQRVRWAKGGMQTIVKNRDMLNFKYGWALIFVFLSYGFWLIYPILSLPLIGYQILYWLPYNMNSIFDASFYLFRWFSFLGPVYAIYMAPVWGISFITIFGILSGIFSTIITGTGLYKYGNRRDYKNYLAVFFYFPYILLLNALMVGGLIKFIKNKKGHFIN